jgi:PAS domain S-box-containing protein
MNEPFASGPAGEPEPAARLRVLHLEDDPHDAELVARRLRADGLACGIVAVDTRLRYEEALASQSFDVILSDDKLPSFDGATALLIARSRVPDVPFLFVSGTIGEEIAIERLKAGATDYVLKERLSRLASAVRRALAEARAKVDAARAQAEVHRLNVELEQRVRDRTAELAGANRILAEREQALGVSEARLQAILDHCPSIIVVKDLDGRLLFVNRQFERSLGRDRSDVVGQSDREVFPPRMMDIYRANDARALSAGSVVQAEEPATEDGVLRVYASSRFPLLDLNGRPYALCLVAADITDRKKAEDEIKVARLEAERANRAKSDFLSRMSHDLRTPLNAVLGFAQLLAVESLAEDQLECVEQISKGGRHLLELINEVLDITRIETGRLSLSPEPVLVGDIVRYTTSLVSPLARDRGITLLVETDTLGERAVLADRQRLAQILLNLLSNAVKYTGSGGRIVLSCSEATPAHLRIAVTDTGPGIPREKMKLLFKPFERLGAESTGIEGTGLGLTLARGLAEAMGGSIGVQSETDVGSTFWVELASTTHASPAVSAAERSASFDPPPALGPAAILYIEDNVSNVRLMQRLLHSRPSLTLLHAPDGHAGIAMVRECRPNLVLLDLHLPDLSGERVLHELWSDPELRRIPVVVVSADATPGQMRRTIASGAAAYLTKPLDLHNVLRVVDKLLLGTISGASSGVPLP